MNAYKDILNNGTITRLKMFYTQERYFKCESIARQR